MGDSPGSLPGGTSLSVSVSVSLVQLSVLGGPDLSGSDVPDSHAGNSGLGGLSVAGSPLLEGGGSRLDDLLPVGGSLSEV